MSTKTVSPAKRRSKVQAGVGSLREEHKRVTRGRMIETAESLFKNNGFRATKVEQIAKMAGTTVTTFYRHFKRKSELAKIMQAHLAVELLGALRQLEAIRDPTRAAIRAWFNQYYEMWSRIHLLSEAFWEAAAEDAEFAAGMLSSTMVLTAQLTDMLEKFPSSIRQRMHLRLTLLVIVMDRVALIVKSEQQNPLRSTVFDEFAEIFHNGLFSR